MKTIVSSNGQINLPDELRQQDGIAPGQKFDLRRIATGCYILSREVPNSPGADGGLMAWLRTCPADDWYVPIPSESTDDL